MNYLTTNMRQFMTTLRKEFFPRRFYSSGIGFGWPFHRRRSSIWTSPPDPRSKICHQDKATSTDDLSTDQNLNRNQEPAAAVGARPRRLSSLEEALSKVTTQCPECNVVMNTIRTRMITEAGGCGHVKCFRCVASERCQQCFPVQYQTRSRRIQVCSYTNCQRQFKKARALHLHVLRAHVFPDRKKLESPKPSTSISASAAPKRGRGRPRKYRAVPNAQSSPVPKKAKVEISSRNFKNSSAEVFPCLHCKRIIRHKRNLIRHMKTHKLGERRNVCVWCSKAFGNHRDLVRHWVVHTGERPYKCTICTRRFTRKDSLIRHMENIHKKKVLPSQVKTLDT